jgi:hypothetical protein
MNSKLFIAKKVKVGFNPRTDTYSGKLGYVIGHDGKKWRKEPSWDGWRYHHMDDDIYQQKKREDYDNRLTSLKRQYKQYEAEVDKNPNSYLASYVKNGLDAYIKDYLGEYESYTPNLGNVSSDEALKPIEFDNLPTEGFVLNKKVGGYSNGWDHRSTYCRVYDPRGFEFEISVPNLLFILQECNSMKGKGLEGTFVYAWDGKDLVLLPTSSLDYQESQNFTELQSCKISAKELVEGYTYKTKQMVDLIYLGRFKTTSTVYGNKLYDNGEDIYIEKKHVFYSPKNTWNDGFEMFSSLGTLASVVSDVPVSNYAELLDKFNNSKHSGEIEDYEEVSPVIPTTHYSYYNRQFNLGQVLLPLGNNSYQIYKLTGWKQGSYSSNKITNYDISSDKILTIKDGEFKVKKCEKIEKTDLSFNNLPSFKLLKSNKENKEYILNF